MDYVSHRFRARATVAEELLTVLQSAGFAAASITRSDGDEDVCLYCAGELPEEAATILQIYQADAVDRQSGDLDRWVGPGPRPLAGDWWVTSEATLAPPDSPCLIVPVDPAFGDGRHPSTRLAAELLLADPPTGQRILDLGCGTGLLACLAAGLGAATIAVADIDAGALACSRRSAAANGCRLDGCWQGDLLQAVPPTARFDLIIGNLYADLIVDLLDDPRLPTVLPDGELLLSGIARQRRDDIGHALAEAGWRVTDTRDGDWWDALRARRDH